MGLLTVFNGSTPPDQLLPQNQYGGAVTKLWRIVTQFVTSIGFFPIKHELLGKFHALFPLNSVRSVHFYVRKMSSLMHEKLDIMCYIRH